MAGVAALLLLAYSQGGGTYTGLEAVSNNVNVLAEPRVHTGKVTMVYMALSLAFTAGGIILLYLLWDARPVEGQTLNAVAFGSIIDSLGWDPGSGHAALLVVLALEAGLLHNQAAMALQRRFHLHGMQMIILPMKLVARS